MRLRSERTKHSVKFRLSAASLGASVCHHRDCQRETAFFKIRYQRLLARSNFIYSSQVMPRLWDLWLGILYFHNGFFELKYKLEMSARPKLSYCFIANTVETELSLGHPVEAAMSCSLLQDFSFIGLLRVARSYFLLARLYRDKCLLSWFPGVEEQHPGTPE